MALKFNSVKCPECGATLQIEDGRTKLFCSYCGSQIIVTNENEYIYRHIDEAKIKEAELNQTVNLKKLEIIERKRAAAEKTKKIKIIVSILMGILGIALMLSGDGSNSITGILVLQAILLLWIFGRKDKEEDIDVGDKVKVPSGIIDYERKSYIEIEAIFKGAGFTNVNCVPLHDLVTGLLKKPDTVASITINGAEITSCNEKFPPDAPVVISYHSFV